MSLSPKQPSANSVEPSIQGPTTLKTIKAMTKRKEPFACLACYDATTARWLERAGVPVLLAGDSAAQVVLGFERTIDMPLDFAVHITAAVKRGAPRTLVMADMPFMTYHRSVDEAMGNAARFMTEGMADVVKLEADETQAGVVDRLTRAGVPICAHVGCRPQTSSVTGGPVAAGRTKQLLEQVVNDASALQDAGAVMLLVEAVPDEVTERIMEIARVPVIGIGAGPACDGQILVVNDLIGLTEHPPRFAEPVSSLGEELLRAGQVWVQRVRDRSVGGHRYTMRTGESQKLSTATGISASTASDQPKK
ncbi:MAG: 3-methyl-2-oxobutanoate hydroxymethyltransferase [Phycisphaerales bacterium]|nr:3-methyl-2-oxobutanoate hydroxymethyltransferase [Phycisphaerales bacterium]